MSRQFTINTSSEPRDFTIVEGGDTRTFTINTGVGPRGYDATITVGTVTTGNAGTNAIVTNVGTTSAAIFNFTIPRGDTGATGATGAAGADGAQGETGLTGFSWDVSRVDPNGYLIGEIVNYQGTYYICIANNDALIPPDNLGFYWNEYSFNSVTSSTTSDGTAELSVADITSQFYKFPTQTSSDNYDVDPVIAPPNFSGETTGVSAEAIYLLPTYPLSDGQTYLARTSNSNGEANITSDTTSNGTASLDVANVTIFPSGRVKFFSSGYAGSIELNGDSATDARAISFPDADGTVALTTDITDSVTSSTTSDGTCDLWIDTLVVGTGTASGDYSVAIGSGTTASGLYSFAGGLNSTASGNLSFAFGGATASGIAAFAFGDGATASADASYAFGTNAEAIHQGASVETDSQIAVTTQSITTDEKVFRFLNGYRFLGGSATFDGTVFANHIHGNIAGNVYTHVRAGEALTKGDPVYVSGSHGSGSTLIPIVSKADASNAAKMPAVGIVDADIASNANGHMVIVGTITELDTNAYAINDTLYVASGGGFTATPPAANSQPVARVERSNTNNGAVIVKVNGLASTGGNGASDANKLVRFSSTGTIPVASIGGLGTGVGTALTNTTNSIGGFVTADGTATLTNKTLTNPTIDTISGTATSNILQNRAGSTRPICALFEDFLGLTGSGTHPWNDSGTGSTDAFLTGGAGNFMGTCRLVTGTTSGNTRLRSLGIASSNIFIGAIVRYGFAIPDITTVNVSIGFAGGGSVCYLYYQSAANSGQWTLQTNAGVTTFTSATPQAGNYFSGKRYQVEIERVSATQTRILLEIADFNLANWSTVYSGTITHSSVSANWGECTPSFSVATQTNAARTLVVDWASLHLPMILR